MVYCYIVVFFFIFSILSIFVLVLHRCTRVRWKILSLTLKDWFLVKKDFIFLHKLSWFQHTWSIVFTSSLFLPRSKRLWKYLSTALSTSSLDAKHFSDANFFKLRNKWKSEGAKSGNKEDGWANQIPNPTIFPLPMHPCE